MKKVWTTVLAIFIVMALVVIGCSKKKNIVVSPDDLGTATASPTAVSPNTATVTRTSVPPGSTNTFTPTQSPTPAYSRPQGWIDDCEDGASIDTGNVCDFNGDNPAPNVGGYWITFDDDDWSNPYPTAGTPGSTVPAGKSNCGTSYVWPESQTWAVRLAVATPGPFSMTAPGYPSSPYGGAYCARMTGYVTVNTIATKPASETQTGFQYGFIGMGVQLTSTAGASGGCMKVNISGYTGVQFWARSTSNGGAGAAFECKLPYTPNTNCDDPILGTLDAFNDYAFHFTVTNAWTKFTVPFVGAAPNHFAQAAGWGTVVTLANVLANASAIQFQSDCQCPYFLAPTGSVDLEIDDIQLYH